MATSRSGAAQRLPQLEGKLWKLNPRGQLFKLVWKERFFKVRRTVCCAHKLLCHGLGHPLHAAALVLCAALGIVISLCFVLSKGANHPVPLLESNSACIRAIGSRGSAHVCGDVHVGGEHLVHPRGQDQDGPSRALLQLPEEAPRKLWLQRPDRRPHLQPPR